MEFLKPVRTSRLSLLGIGALSLSACGVKEGRYKLHPEPPPVIRPAVEALQGTLPLSDGSQIDLSVAESRPTVLVFASDTCTTCTHEAHSFRDSLRNGAPSKIRLLSVLVGAIREDAEAWRDDHHIPWSVGYDSDNILFKKYCSGNKVPCTLVYKNGEGIVYTKTGESLLSEITALTGPWED